MDSINDILQHKAVDLDISSRKSQLELLQAELERYFPKGVRVRKMFPDKSLLIATPNPMLATDVRYAQVAILQSLRQIEPDIKRLSIRIQN